MTTLVTAIYTEGPTDERFLPVILQRTLVDLLGEGSEDVVDVLQPILLNPDHKASRTEDILAVARKAAGYHLLFIHADADEPTQASALAYRIQPGIALVKARQAAGEEVCRDLVPVIPVHMVEAWLLADPEALRAAIGTTLSSVDLGIPLRPREIEGDAHPKERLAEILRTARALRPRRRRKVDIGDLYQPLAEQISMESLRRLPAFQQLIADLKAALASLSFIYR